MITSPEDIGISCADWRVTPLDARLFRLRAARPDMNDSQLDVLGRLFDQVCAANRAPAPIAPAALAIRPAGQQFYPDESRVSNWLTRMGLRCTEWLDLPPAAQDARVLAAAQASRLGMTFQQAHELASNLTQHCRMMVGQAPVAPTGEWLPQISEDRGGFVPVYLSPTVVPLYPATYPWFGSAWWRVRSEWLPYLTKNNFANWPVNWPLWDGGKFVMKQGPIAGTAMRTSMLSNRPGMLTPAAYRAVT